MKKLLYLILLLPICALSQTKLPTAHTTLNVANVIDYGAKSDGTTDATTAFRAALNYLNHNGGGELYIPTQGTYLISDSLVLAQGISVWSGNGISEQADSTTGGKITRYAPGTILFNQAGKNCWVINHAYCQFQGVGVVNTSGSTPTSCHAFLWNNAIGMRMTNCSAYYNYEGVHVTNSLPINTSSENGSIIGCFFSSNKNYNIFMENQTTCDGGDFLIDGVYSYQGFFTGSSHIRQKSGGGLKVTNCKLNQGGPNFPLHGIYANITCHTVDLIVTGNSIENFTGHGVYADASGGGSFSNVIVNNNQISNNTGHGTGFNDITLGLSSTVNNQVVMGNAISCQSVGNSGTNTGYAVQSFGNNVTIGPNQVTVVGVGSYDNYATFGASGVTINRNNYVNTIASGSTAIFDFSYSTQQYNVLTANTQLQLANEGFNIGKLIVKQNATGGWNLTGNFTVDFFGPIKTINPAPNSYTILDIGYVYDGNGYPVTIEDWRSTDYANLTAQSAAGTIKSITSSGATATYNISGYVNVTAAPVTDVIQYQITYTDEGNNAQTISGPLISTQSNNQIPVTPIRVKASTTITVKTNLTTGGGTVAFDAGATIQQVN